MEKHILVWNTLPVVKTFHVNCLVSYDVTLKCQSKNMMIAFNKCQKWKEQDKVSYHRRFWTLILKIEEW
jgi:hypothetical protein